jgi:hypothetical protein
MQLPGIIHTHEQVGEIKLNSARLAGRVREGA